MDTASTDGVFDVSNLDRLGHSEVSLVQQVVDGVELLVKVKMKLKEKINFYVLCSLSLTLSLSHTHTHSCQMEKKLEAGESIDDLVPK